MNRPAWSVFFKTATTNSRVVVVSCLVEAVGLAASIAFTVTLATFFGYDVFGMAAYVPRGDAALFVATGLAAISMAARFFHGWLDAFVAATRERWIAHRIRTLGGKSDGRHVARASHHFGRLSATSMRACSGLFVIAGTVIVLALVLPFSVFLPALAIAVVSAALLAIPFGALSRLMSKASTTMVDLSREVAFWKSNAERPDSASVDNYYAAYFRRIFLASIFSSAPWMFVIVLLVGLMILDQMGVTVNFGEIFVGFVIAQLYLGLIVRLFNSAIKAAALTPAVMPFVAALDVE